MYVTQKKKVVHDYDERETKMKFVYDYDERETEKESCVGLIL